MTERLRVIHADVMEGLAQLEDESVQVVCTSPPYWGLRAYTEDSREIGREKDFREYIEKMVAVFREVRRVLRKDGTCWVNMGDCYISGPTGNPLSGSTLQGGKRTQIEASKRPAKTGLKPKDLVMMPHRLAIALQEDGWWVRNDCVWSKPNAMPESVTDRPTRSHEYVFLLSRSERYYYDAEAVKEPVTGNAHARGDGVNPKACGTNSRMYQDRDPSHSSDRKPRVKQNEFFSGSVNQVVSKRNLRSVWTIATQPYPGSHFATFPERIPEIAILAGSSEKGACARCGAPWVRVVEKKAATMNIRIRDAKKGILDKKSGGKATMDEMDGYGQEEMGSSRTVGWKPSCKCECPMTRPCVVLDPFGGSGTTGRMALKHRRHAILIELVEEYLPLIEERTLEYVMQGELI